MSLIDYRHARTLDLLAAGPALLAGRKFRHRPSGRVIGGKALVALVAAGLAEPATLHDLVDDAEGVARIGVRLTAAGWRARAELSLPLAGRVARGRAASGAPGGVAPGLAP